MRNVTIISLIALGVCLLSLRPATAQDGGKTTDAEAQRAFEAGANAYEEGRFREALAAFERSYELSHRPKLLFNIGRAADGDGQAQRAVDAYKAYLLAFPKAENVKFVESRISKMNAVLMEQRPKTASSAPPGTPLNATPFVQQLLKRRYDLEKAVSKGGPTEQRPPRVLMAVGAGASVLGGALLAIATGTKGDDQRYNYRVAGSLVFLSASVATVVTGGIMLRVRKNRVRRTAELKEVNDELRRLGASISPLISTARSGPFGAQVSFSF